MTIARRAFLKSICVGAGASALACIASRNNGSILYASAKPTKKVLIAHRGASAYAPEHTLEAYQLAIRQGADFVEQDLQITRDGVLVCLHDVTLNRTTNVEEVFPDRFKEEVVNGKTEKRWYVHDFTLSEIKQLDAGSWFNAKYKGSKVLTWQESIEAIKGKAGLYPETKAPEYYGRLGFDMEAMVVQVLKRNGLDRLRSHSKTPVILQSFSDASLKSFRKKIDLPLVMSVGSGARRWLTSQGLNEAKEFASVISPFKTIIDESLVKRAHDIGLVVNTWTFTSTAVQQGYKDVSEEMAHYLYNLGVDTIVTDNPDRFPLSKT